MKGYTTLKVIDPQTQKVERELKKEENYITDFINQIYNKLPQNLDVGGSGLAQLSNLVFSNFCQGIMLFPDALPSSGCYVPGISDSLTGYASDVYSGTDVKRGSLNTLESGEITNGYRKVWDFGTGVAVGDISSLSLIAADAGKNDFETGLSSAFVGISGSGTGNVISYAYTEYEAGGVYFIPHITDDYVLFSVKTSSISYSGSIYGHFNWNDFWVFDRKLQDKFPYNTPMALKVTRPIKKTTFSIQNTPTGYTRAAEPSIDNTYLYILFYQSTIGFKLHRYLCSTGEFVDELTYDFTYTLAPNKFIITNDRIIWNNGSNIYWVNKNTLVENSITNPLGGNILGFCMSKVHLDTLFAISKTGFEFQNSETGYINLNTGTLKHYFNNNLILAGYNGYNSSSSSYYDYFNRFACGVLLDEPLIYMTSTHCSDNRSRYYGSCISMGLMGYTLATINNLSSTLYKPADKVLKVIYDITW